MPPSTNSYVPLRAVSLALLCYIALLGSVGCGRSDDSASTVTDTTKTIPFEREGRLAVVQDGDSTVIIDIEIADTDSARQRGMMQREGFPNDRSGMLFLFDTEEPRSFWMSNTPVALDILFVDADSQIVSIAKYTTPYSSEQIQSGEPAQFVLETPAGFADSYGLLEGDRIRWRRTDQD